MVGPFSVVLSLVSPTENWAGELELEECSGEEAPASAASAKEDDNEMGEGKEMEREGAANEETGANGV